MVNSKLFFYAVILVASFLPPTSAFSQVYKCVDASGKTTFSDQGCANNHSAITVDLGHVNTQDSSQYQQRIFEDRLERSQPKQKMRVTVVGDGGSIQQGCMQDKLCREALAQHKGAHSLTAVQQSIAASCVSGSFFGSYDKKSVGSDTLPSTPPDSAPSHITNCDADGCWDNQGGRYNKVAGSNYFRQDGKACQSIGGQMQCN